MPVGTTVAQVANSNKREIDKRSQIGNWEIPSWVRVSFPAWPQSARFRRYKYAQPSGLFRQIGLP
jgi:hypothetical protein